MSSADPDRALSTEGDSEPPKEEGRVFGFSDLADAWWRKRTTIAILALQGAIVAAVIAAAIFVVRPVRQESTLAFKLLFDGVAQGQYPGGRRFVPADIVATPVLQEVYRRNALSRFLEFPDFKDALSVSDSNAALERLRREYQGRLQDRRLTPLDRKKIEDEYDARAKALHNGEFTLVLDIKGSFARWPEALAGKVLTDTLTVWAEQSREQGVFKFDLNIFSKNILTEIDPNTDDYPMLLDRIRVTIDRLLDNLDELARVPGAPLIRVGDSKISLGEVEAMLQDDTKYRLSMIEAPVYSLGFYRDRMLSEAYIREQLFRLKRETQSVESQIAASRQALAAYNASRTGGRLAADGAASEGGLAPDSFLDRMLDLSTRSADVAFRQGIVHDILKLNSQLVDLASERQIYEKMQRALAAKGAEIQERREEMEPWVQAQIKDMLEGLHRSLDYVSLLHAEISQRNLQASTVYAVPEPVRQVSISPVGLRTLAVLWGMGWIGYLAIMLGVMAWHTAKSA